MVFCEVRNFKKDEGVPHTLGFLYDQGPYKFIEMFPEDEFNMVVEKNGVRYKVMSIDFDFL